MCPHNDFDYMECKDGLILRRCKDCGIVEVQYVDDDHWVHLVRLYQNQRKGEKR